MNNFLRATRDKRRTGISLIEVTAALLILSVAVVSVAQLVALAEVQRRDASRRQLASSEAGNALEHLAARRWDELDAERLKEFSLSPRARQALPGARLTVAVEPASAGEAKRIIVEVVWTTRFEQTERVRLVAWKFAGQESQP
jgi:hypothetical protein